MLNDGGNENGKTNTQTKKTTIRLISNNNNNFARAAHFFLHFFVVVLHDYSVKLSSYTFHGGNVSWSHKKFCFLCSCSLSFSLPLIFTILAAKIYHFHFFFFFVFVFCFIFRSSPSSVKTRLCCCCFSFSKSSGGQDYHNIDVYHHVKHRLQTRHRKTDHFTLVTLWCGRKDGWTGGRAYGHVTTKISRMHE